MSMRRKSSLTILHVFRNNHDRTFLEDHSEQLDQVGMIEETAWANRYQLKGKNKSKPLSCVKM